MNGAGRARNRGPSSRRDALQRRVNVSIGTLGPRPQRLHPQAEAPLARRTAIVALVFFLGSALHLAVAGVGLTELARAFPLYALGGFCILIFGTSRLLIAGMAGRDSVGGAASSVATVGLAGLGAAGVYASQFAAPLLTPAFAFVWSAGAMLHVVVTIRTVRRPPTRAPIVDETATRASRVPLRVLEAGSLAYALASAVCVPLAFAGLAAPASALHLVLSGFVIVTIIGTALHILPRFTRVRPTPFLVVLLVPFVLVGPALVVFGLEGVSGALAVGATAEAVALLLFGAAVVVMVLRARVARVANLAYLGAPVAVAVGGFIAFLVANGVHLEGQLATHGILNVFGFVGLFVMGASTDLYAPALEAGAKSARRHVVVAMTLTLGGLVVAGAGSWVGSDAFARGGMLLYAAGLAWHLAGVVASHRRAERVIMRMGA